jgi:hypothetical protein
VDEFDGVVTAEEEAQAASGKFNFGRLKITPRFLAWKDKQPTEIDAQTYATLDARSRSLEYVFGVDIQEFKPDLRFTYERKIQVGGLDWGKIFKPSLEAVIGAGSTDKDTLANTLRRLSGRYVCFEDVPQTPTKNKPERSKYSTASLVKVYDTRELCFAAWHEKYGGESAGNGAAPDVPSGYTAETWAKQAADIEKLRIAYIGKGNTPAQATELAAAEYGATAGQVVKLLKLPDAHAIPF